MNKLLTLAVVGILICSAAQVFALDKGPDSINLNAQKNHSGVIKGEDSRYVNNFPHHKHQDEFLKGNHSYSKFEYTDDWTCSACHHMSFEDEQPQSCFKCKDVDKMLHTIGGAKKFNKLFHLTCRDCHLQMKKDGKKTGPVKCNGCHNR